MLGVPPGKATLIERVRYDCLTNTILDVEVAQFATSQNEKKRALYIKMRFEIAIGFDRFELVASRAW